MRDIPLALHMPARRDANPARWRTFVIGVETPVISLLSSVESYADAQTCADRYFDGRLRIELEAWEQMVQAGAAPQTLPRTITVV